MQLYIDVDSNQLVKGAGNLTPVPSLSFKRGDAVTLNVCFVQDGIIIQLPDDATGIFGLKTSGQYDGAFLVSSLSWTKTGSGASTVYTFAPSFNTTELNALLDNSGNPKASVSLMGEIEWRTGGSTESTQTVQVTVNNDVIKDDETGPSSADNAPANQVWAGPTSGVDPGMGAFRPLVAQDLPILPWLVKTRAYTASSRDRIQADTSGGSFTITLPPAPVVGDEILIQDASLSWGIHNLTLGRNGLKINGGASNYIADVEGGKVSAVYISAAYGWSIK